MFQFSIRDSLFILIIISLLINTGTLIYKTDKYQRESEQWKRAYYQEKDMLEKLVKEFGNYLKENQE